MRRAPTLAAYLLFFLTLSLARVAPAQQAQPLPEAVLKLMRAAQIPPEAIGTKVVRISDGAIVLAYQPERSMQPASTMKLVTTLVGMERLGPAYRGRTEFASSAEVVNHVLQGNLILRGVGDANLDWQAFQSMLQTLRQKGIKEIRGNLVIDREFFQPPRTDIGAPPFDESPEFRYNVIPDALLLNMNLAQFYLSADAEKITVGMTPQLDGVTVISNMTLIERDCTDWEDGWVSPSVSRDERGTIQIALNGTFPKSCAINTELNVLDRLDYADRLFRSLWRQLGGTFAGITREGNTNEGARVLAEHRARPLGEMIRDINKPSDNALARLLYLTLGVQHERLETSNLGVKLTPTADTFNRLNTSAEAEQKIRAWFAEHKIDDRGLVLDNGSGLSRTERITPSQMTALLTAGARSNWAPEFMASLPIAGLDGTMRKRLRGSDVAQRARLKTGTLKDVVALAGFVPDGNNEPCVIAAFINHPLAASSVAQPILDALINWVSKSKTESKWALPLSAYAGS